MEAEKRTVSVGFGEELPRLCGSCGAHTRRRVTLVFAKTGRFIARRRVAWAGVLAALARWSWRLGLLAVAGLALMWMAGLSMCDAPGHNMDGLFLLVTAVGLALKFWPLLLVAGVGAIAAWIHRASAPSEAGGSTLSVGECRRCARRDPVLPLSEGAAAVTLELHPAVADRLSDGLASTVRVFD